MVDKQHIVVSFDIGIKNLAYCVIRNGELEGDVITDMTSWGVHDISHGQKKPTFEDMCSNLITFLDSLVQELALCSSVDVLIENQPAFKAPTMKSIQIFIYAYFKIKGHQPKLISASVKNKYMQQCGFELKAKDYKSNKQTSIMCVNEFIKHRCWTVAQDILAISKKKDDLCDALLQALAFLKISWKRPDESVVDQPIDTSLIPHTSCVEII